MDFDGDGRPDIFITHQMTPEIAADAFVWWLSVLGILGAAALVVYGLTMGTLNFVEWSDTWPTAVWWGLGAAAYLIIPSSIVGLCHGSLGGSVVAFFVLSLTILVPLAVYHLYLFLATWTAAT